MKIEILQAEGNVKLLTQMVSLRRATQQQLDEAIAKLNLLKAKAAEVVEVQKTIPQKINRVVEVEKVAKDNPLLFELLKKFRQKRAEQSELANELKDVPPLESCPKLTGKIIELQQEIESIWTKYRYVQKNGVLPDEVSEELEIKSSSLLRLEAERQGLSEKRSKLKRKLATPGNKPKKIEEWNEELIKVQANIEDLDDKIRALK